MQPAFVKTGNLLQEPSSCVLSGLETRIYSEKEQEEIGDFIKGHSILMFVQEILKYCNRKFHPLNKQKGEILINTHIF